MYTAMIAKTSILETPTTPTDKIAFSLIPLRNKKLVFTRDNTTAV
jgi:hypothetical protein